MDLPHYLRLIRRNAFVIFMFVLVAITIAVFQSSTSPKVYESTASVLLRPENVPTDPNFAGDSARFDPVRYGNVQLAVVTSAGVVEAAAAAVPDLSTADLLANVSTTIDEQGAILTVSATARDPERAAETANALVTAYLEQRALTETGTIQQAISELETSLAALTERLAELESVPVLENGLPGADITATQDQYSIVFGRLQDLSIQLSLQRPTAEVLEAAESPVAPIGLGLPAKVILAALLGAVLGIGVSFAREELDDKVRSREEVQALTFVPVLAELPLDRRSSRSETHLATTDEPLGTFAEGIRSLRTSISFLSVDRPEPIGRLLVTSTVAGDGKTLVAANLAVAYAQAGHRTILVSADLRRPRLEQLFGRQVGGAGLADVFSDDAPRRNGVRTAITDVLERVVVVTRVENLWLLPAGSAVPNPAELLSSSRMDEILAVLSESFDMVIVDTSPLLAVTDAAALAPKVGHVIVVANMHGTRRRALGRAAEVVHATRAEVLGVVLNRVSGQLAAYASSGSYVGRSANLPAAKDTSPPERTRSARFAAAEAFSRRIGRRRGRPAASS